MRYVAHKLWHDREQKHPVAHLPPPPCSRRSSHHRFLASSSCSCFPSRFLQGPDTDKAEIAKLKEALLAGESWCGRLLNYKKDGSPFWNLLTVTPVKDDNGKVSKFIG